MTIVQRKVLIDIRKKGNFFHKNRIDLKRRYFLQINNHKKIIKEQKVQIIKSHTVLN
jgi:hypothetical protein